MGHASLKAIALVVRQHNKARRQHNKARRALQTAERRFLAAALDYGCTEITAQSRVPVVMRRLRARLERQQASEKKLQALLHRLTEPD